MSPTVKTTAAGGVLLTTRLADRLGVRPGDIFE